MNSPATASVSTHVLDTAAGRPAAAVAVELAVRTGPTDGWSHHDTSRTDPDGRCRDLAALPPGATHARLRFAVEPYLSRTAGDRPPAGGSFFPEVAVVFAVAPGEHYHVPLLLSPFGYSVYRGS
ncbi:hydroxyisourate hydrolase [Streptomyces sp. ACA25]|uniref:hydroxyisourate hydrolase n=1 Tax=Streptomyces sp. ACA25 TaxID=3022596 RepID=UPI002307113B|nr:hydroxyisourate hydrolase [Streptomyces sp. ACA25]MDB1089218.1 hydroxyisourate hydrolase [Streptomyces sp. ACA25]